MDPSSSTTLSTRKGLLWLDRLLRLVTVVFVLGTLVFVANLGALVGGRGGVAVDAVLEPPLDVTIDDGPTIDVLANGEVDGRELGLERAAVRAKLRLDEDDLDSRLVLAASGLLLIAAFWVGMVMTRRIVRSARDGKPFDPRNAIRLRVLGALFVAVPVGAEITGRLLGATVEGEPGVSVSTASPDWGVSVLVALGLLALAEVFNEGTVLRDLEDRTI